MTASPARRRSLVAVAVAAAAALLVPVAVSSSYLFGVLHLALMYALLTQGLNFTQGFSGRTSLGHIGFWAIGAYATGLLAGQLGWPSLVALLVGVLAASIVALALAVLTNSLRAFYLALATLGFAQILQIVAKNWTEVTNGSNGVTGVPYLGLFGFEFDSPTSQYYLLLTAVVLGAWFTRRFVATKLGRDAFALRQSEVAAESLGIRTSRVKTLTLVLSAIYAAVAGSLYAHTFGYISPDVFSFAAMLLVLAMLVVGGQETIWGPVVGAVVVTLLPELLRVSDRYWLLLYGIGLYVVMVRMPGGIVGLARSLSDRAAGRRRPDDVEEAPAVVEAVRQDRLPRKAAAP
jgi:branched-chain amino acid transport system permease protein